MTVFPSGFTEKWRAVGAMRDVPVPLVRANQYFLAGGVLAAVLLRQPLIVAALLGVVLAGLVGGPRAHLVFALARPLLGRRLTGAPTEDGRLQRFNQTLAGAMLAASTALFAAGAPLAGWIVAGVLAAVALAGAWGFCLGCRLYWLLGPWIGAQRRV
jgi:hypothetical protein